MQGRWKYGHHQRMFTWNEASYEVTDLVTFVGEQETIPSVECKIIRLPLPEQRVKRPRANVLELPLLRMVAEHDWERMSQPVFSPDGPLRVYCNTVDLPRGGEVSAKHVVHITRA